MKEGQLFNTRPRHKRYELVWEGAGASSMEQAYSPLMLFGPSDQFIQMGMAAVLRQRQSLHPGV